MDSVDNSFELERALGFYVNRAAYVMSEAIAERFRSMGYQLTAQDFGILFRLSKEGGLSQVQIANLMMRDKTTITRRLDALGKKELIERKKDQSDRRLFRIYLTSKGYQVTTALMEAVGGFQQEVLSDISDAEKEVSIKTLKKITDYITRREV